jgi:hypothetical protein
VKRYSELARQIIEIAQAVPCRFDEVLFRVRENYDRQVATQDPVRMHP